MEHFDKACPNKIYGLHYENLITNFDTEVRALLDFCELPVETECFSYFENARGVRSPSSQQVRLPIYTAGLDKHRMYEPWLAPLKAA